MGNSVKYDFQPIRELLALCAAAFLMAGWWYVLRSTDSPPALAFMETSLVLIIGAEAFARDE